MFRKYATRLCRSWRQDDAGATAVEFAFVATIFFWVFIGIIEMGLLMIFNNGIEDGVERASRLIRTGQAQNTSISEEEFRKKVCGQVMLKSSCETSLVVDVREFVDFASINAPAPTWNDQENKLEIEDKRFELGGPRRVILVRVFYDWNFITPLIGTLMGNTNRNSFLLSAATAFRNEPYAR